MRGHIRPLSRRALAGGELEDTIARRGEVTDARCEKLPTEDEKAPPRAGLDKCESVEDGCYYSEKSKDRTLFCSSIRLRARE